MPSDFDTAADLLRHGYRADFDAQLDAARQEGRNEILKEIAALSWITTNSQCHFCGAMIPRIASPHLPSCLYRRAIATSVGVSALWRNGTGKE